MTGSAGGDAGAAIRFGRIELWPRDRLLVVAGTPRALGSRAFDLLVALAERPGRLVTKNELLDLVWPDVVVEENNLHVQMTQIRKALGNEVIATIPGRGYRFVQRIDGAALPTPEAVPAAPAGPASAPRRVRAALGPGVSRLVGREDALVALQERTREHRLVSVVGSGGIGKTSLVRRLLLEADAALDRVDFVELASLTDPTDVARTVGVALGLELGTADPAAALGAQLAPLNALVALDNVEHLVDGVAAVVGPLLAAAPGLRIVVTSQAPLRVQGERVYRLEGLSVPGPASGAGEAAAHGAVALFVDRAEAADRRFALTDDNVAEVVEICRRLDGVPLAIELAAARVPLLGLDGLAAALGERLRVLTGGPRDAPARQRTLRAMLEWGHALLAETERTVFRRLAVFAGSASLEAIRHVAADEPPGPLDEWTLLDALGTLVDRSVVAVLFDPADAHAPPRYRLHESPRSLACEQLAASGEDDAVRRRHATWFVELAETQWGAVGTGASRGVLAVEHDNLRACLDWTAGHDVALGLRAAAALIPFWRERGYHAEALRRCDALLAHPGVEVAHATRMRLSLGLCALAFEQGLPGLLERYATDAIERCRAQGDRSNEAACLAWLAHAVLFAGDRAGAIAAFRSSVEAARHGGDDRRVAEGLTNVGCLLNEQGDGAEAGPLLLEAMALYRRLDNTWGIGFATEILGEVAYAKGDFEEARRCFVDSLALYRDLQHQHRIASSTRLLACAEHRLGHLDEALLHVGQCLELAGKHGFSVYAACGLATAARIAITRGAPALAARLLGAAQEQMDRKSVRLEGPELAEHAAALEAARVACGPRAWEEAWNAGRGMTLQQAAALARGGPPARPD
jgi:predicted ATPase/DNA-binding winged helix-turn-helix (wHTH) protein